MTTLLDMVKEADLRLGFTDALKSSTAYESLSRDILQPRLLLLHPRHWYEHWPAALQASNPASRTRTLLM